MASWHRNLRRPWNEGLSSIQGLNRSRAKDKRKSVVSVRNILLLGVAAVVLWVSTLAWWSHSMMTPKKDTHAATTVSISRQSVEKNDPDPEGSEESMSLGVGELWPDDYGSKALFDTLQGCDPNKEEEQHRKCPKQPATRSHQRIGLFYPPGALSYMFIQFVKDVVRLHALPDTDLELVPTTHIHVHQHNFTKIIRLAILPMLLSGADSIASTLDPWSSTSASPFRMDSVTLDDFLTATRQLLRWHCHLSRVAENTPLMTMTLADLIENPWEVELNLRSFLSLEPHDPNNSNEWAEKHVDEDEMTSSLEEMIKYCSSLFQHLEKTTKKIQSVVQGVIDEEMKVNSATCKPVRELEGSSVVTRTLGAFLSSDSQLSDAICKTRSSTPICKDREAPVSSRTQREK